MDKYQILLEALNRIAQITPAQKGTGSRIAKTALFQFYELQREELAKSPEVVETSILDKYKSYPCSCDRTKCKDRCCGQCGCVPCFLSSREAWKTTNTNNAA